jgi:hypothetical protein
MDNYDVVLLRDGRKGTIVETFEDVLSSYMIEFKDNLLETHREDEIQELLFNARCYTKPYEGMIEELTSKGFIIRSFLNIKDSIDGGQMKVSKSDPSVSYETAIEIIRRHGEFNNVNWCNFKGKELESLPYIWAFIFENVWQYRMWNLHEYVTHWYYQRMHSYSRDLLGKSCTKVGYFIAREIYQYFKGTTDIASLENRTKGWKEIISETDDEWFKKEMEDYYKWSRDRNSFEYEADDFMI